MGLGWNAGQGCWFLLPTTTRLVCAARSIRLHFSESSWHELARMIPKRCGTPTRERRYPHSGQFECEQSGPGLSAEVNIVMNSIIYLVGLIVVVMFILGALGLH